MPQSAERRQPPRCGVFFRIRHLARIVSVSLYPENRTKPPIEKVFMNYIFIASA